MTSTVQGGNIYTDHRARWKQEVKMMYKNLNAEMTRHSISASDIAAVLHKTDRSVRDKLAGRSDFTLSEIMAIRRSFFPKLALEYLFATTDSEVT